MQDVHSRNFIVRVYYRYRVFMGICCICCEVLYLALYMQHWQPDQSWPCTPKFLLAVLPSTCATVVVHLYCSGHRSRLCTGQDHWRLLSPTTLVGAALPGWAIKQGINVAQLRSAAAKLVEYDAKKSQAEVAKHS